MRRYPLAALLEATGLTESGLTREVGLSGSTLKKAREVGFTADAADRYAVRCGLTPLEVWPDYGQVPCVECGQLFAQTRSTHRYCEWNCAARAGRRRRYAEDPAYREQRKAAARRHKEENRRAEQIAGAQYRERNRERLAAAQRERDRRKREERVA